jgi:hypothetical protein
VEVLERKNAGTVMEQAEHGEKLQAKGYGFPGRFLEKSS